MAGQVPDNEITRKADADLSGVTNRGRAVVLTAANGAALSGANGKAIGILDNLPKLGSAARIITGGTAKVRAGAAYAVNARLASDAAGKLVTAAADETVIAIAMEAALAADELHEARIVPGATSESA
jgi:hypothetical protein